MNLLKKEYWWLWGILFLTTGGASNIFLASELKVLNKESWYANYKNWLVGALCLLFPFLFMIIIFQIQTLALSAAKLELKGKEIYLTPYIWILLIIIPIFGWLLLIVLALYLQIGVIVMLAKGKGEISVN